MLLLLLGGVPTSSFFIYKAASLFLSPRRCGLSSGAPVQVPSRCVSILSAVPFVLPQSELHPQHLLHIKIFFSSLGTTTTTTTQVTNIASSVCSCFCASVSHLSLTFFVDVVVRRRRCRRRNICNYSFLNLKCNKGGGCGSLGRAVASYSRGPWFESSYRQNVNCIEKTKINEKEARNGPF